MSFKTKRNCCSEIMPRERIDPLALVAHRFRSRSDEDSSSRQYFSLGLCLRRARHPHPHLKRERPKHQAFSLLACLCYLEFLPESDGTKMSKIAVCPRGCFSSDARGSSAHTVNERSDCSVKVKASGGTSSATQKGTLRFGISRPEPNHPGGMFHQERKNVSPFANPGVWGEGKAAIEKFSRT